MKPRGIDIGTGELLPPSLVGVMVLLDRSGSMKSIRGAMQKAFDDFVAEQRALSTDGMWVTLHQFDSDGYDEVYERKPLADVPALDLRPRGGTPLIDSLCRFVTGARAIIDDPTDPTERLLVVVITDGQDTGGNTHTWVQAREMVQGIETTDSELIWFGTTAAILEAQEHVPVVAVAGASLGYEATAAGAAYLGKGFSNTVASVRAGLRSAKAANVAYASSGGAYDYTKDEEFQKQWAKASELLKDRKSGGKA